MSTCVFLCIHVTVRISADVFAAAHGCLVVYMCGCLCVLPFYVYLYVYPPDHDSLLSLLLPPYIINPKDLKISTAAFD